jgi:hypothetical protein
MLGRVVAILERLVTGCAGKLPSADIEDCRARRYLS